jgi:hypothetical protein
VLGPGDEPAIRGDDFGFDPLFTERIKGAALWVYRNYFRVEVDGIRNVPATGRALLAANHSGVIPYDGVAGPGRSAASAVEVVHRLRQADRRIALRT